MVALLVAGCAEAPPAPATPQPHPLAGAWDVVAVLDQFSFEIGSTFEASECNPNVSPYCYIRRPSGPDTLRGTIMIGDVIDSLPNGQWGTDYKFPANGFFTGSFCEEPDYRKTDGCAVHGPPTSLDYPGGVVHLAPGAPESEKLKGTVTGPGIPFSYRYVSWSATQSSREEFSGNVYWALTVWRNAPAYQGTFVARRRH